jgi:hypothetical protein
MGKATLAALAVSLFVGIAGVLLVYQYTAEAGILGEQAREKYEEQASGRYGLLLGGRTEILGELPAIYDSPILGHGSWARDPTYIIEMVEGLAALGYKDPTNGLMGDELIEGSIPSHSYIFGAWVHAGILGGVFWASVFLWTARSLLRVYPPSLELLPVMAYAAFALLWNIAFSAVGLTSRILDPYYIVLIMTCHVFAVSKAVPVAGSGAKRLPSPVRTRA